MRPYSQISAHGWAALRLLLLTLAVGSLWGCADNQQDIEAWMAEQAASMRGKVDPLPEIKIADTVDYTGYDYPDPFRPVSREVQVAPSTSAFRPDLTRRRGPLEAYPVETLSFVGVLEMEGEAVALIRASDESGTSTLYQVRRGNYMGQDFGMVSDIGESELTLKELVEDLNGEWGERLTTLQIQES